MKKKDTFNVIILCGYIVGPIFAFGHHYFQIKDKMDNYHYLKTVSTDECLEYQYFDQQECSGGALKGAALGGLVGEPMTGMLIGMATKNCQDTGKVSKSCSLWNKKLICAKFPFGFEVDMINCENVKR